MRENARELSSNKFNILDHVPDHTVMPTVSLDKSKAGAKKPMNWFTNDPEELASVYLSDDDSAVEIENEGARLLRVEEERLEKEKEMELIMHRAQADGVKNELADLIGKAEKKRTRRKGDDDGEDESYDSEDSP